MSKKVHFIKTLPKYFQASKMRLKTFELRKNDRDYKKGDLVVSREWTKEKGYTNNYDIFEVTYVLPGGEYGLDKDYVILNIYKIELETAIKIIRLMRFQNERHVISHLEEITKLKIS